MMALTKVLLRSVMYRTVIITKHPTTLVWLIFCINMSWVLGISQALVFDRNQVSYGQVLSLFTPLPGLWSFGKILIDHQADIRNFIKHSPSFVSRGLSFIITGRNEWSTPEEIVDRDYFHWSRLRLLVSECRRLYRQIFLFPSRFCQLMLSF